MVKCETTYPIYTDVLCINVYIHHGSISHLTGLVQLKSKEKNNLRLLRLFFLSFPNLFSTLFLFIDYHDTLPTSLVRLQTHS
jgi:hypothetical protein